MPSLAARSHLAGAPCSKLHFSVARICIDDFRSTSRLGYRRTASFFLYGGGRIQGHLQCRRDKRQRKRVCTRIIQSSRGAHKGRRSLKNTRQNVFPSGNHRCPTRQVRAPSCRTPPPHPPLAYAGPEFKVTPLLGRIDGTRASGGRGRGSRQEERLGREATRAGRKSEIGSREREGGDRKGVGRSRGQGETMSHRPESRVRARYTLLQDASASLHLHAVAQWGCGVATFTAAHRVPRRHTVPVPLNVPRRYHPPPPSGHG